MFPFVKHYYTPHTFLCVGFSSIQFFLGQFLEYSIQLGIGNIEAGYRIHKFLIGSVSACGLQLIPSLFAEFRSEAVPVWAQLLALLVMLSVSLHINLSPADLRGVAGALPVYLAVTLVLAVVTTLLGRAVTGPVLGVLQSFHTFMMATFTVVLVFAAAQVALALVLRVLLRPVRC